MEQESVFVTLEFIMNEGEYSWDPASMGLPFLESDSGWDDPQNKAEAIAAMALEAIERNITKHDGYEPFGDIRGYYSDKSSENPRFSARYRLVEVGNLNTLNYRVDRANAGAGGGEQGTSLSI